MEEHRIRAETSRLGPRLRCPDRWLRAEFTLKARLCTRRGWATFPDSPAEAKQRGAPERLFTHDLEQLLRYTNDIAIKTTSLHGVNWKRASDWSVDQRYTPVGTLTAKDVSVQIEETQKLFVELVLWEILEQLVKVEAEQSAIRGPFNFFALVRDPQVDGWAVWFAA